MPTVRIFQHEPAEGPGYLEEFLAARGIAPEVVRVDRGEALDAGAADALVLLGARTDPHHGPSWLERERALLRAAADRGLPLLGHGFGAELIAQTLGARVVRNPVRQVGWFEAQSVADPASSWAAALPERCMLFKWHRQSFEAPPGAVRLLHSEWCSTEAFALGNVLALQAHLEVTAPMIRSWSEAYAADIAQPTAEPDPASGLSLNWEAIVQGADKLLLNVDAKVQALHGLAERVYGHWLAQW